MKILYKETTKEIIRVVPDSQVKEFSHTSNSVVEIDVDEDVGLIALMTNDDAPILIYTTTTPPEINQETHYLTSKYEVDMERKEYRQVWEVHEVVVVAPQTTLSEVIGILIKKVVDGIPLTEQETLTLKSYNDGTENYL